MPPRPSESLLRVLRDASRARGMNTAALARAAGLERTRLKHVLAGTEPLTVDDFSLLAGALSLSPADLGIALPEGAQAAAEEPEEEDYDDDLPPEAGSAAISLRAVGRRERPPAEVIRPDPLGNHAEQLFRLGFALGCDLLFIADPAELEQSGVPATVLSRFPKGLPIRLDAAFHRHNNPQFMAEGLQLTLSFDAIYTCLFPWEALREVTFFPLPPSEPEPEPEEEPKGIRRGHLRLIE